MLSSGHVSGHRSAVRLDYVSSLRHLLTKPLAEHQEAGIPQVVVWGERAQQFSFFVSAILQ